MKVMDIVAVARSSGLPASTLRHYEKMGLIASVGRSGLRRTFDRRVLDRLAFIALGRTAGFSLEEIGGMFAADGSARIDRAVLARRADEIDAKIRRLSAVRDSLRHAVKCPARTHAECPTFQRLLRRAAEGAAASQTKRAVHLRKSGVGKR
jgi:DNA-binding transcriptional MerR regulator